MFFLTIRCPTAIPKPYNLLLMPLKSVNQLFGEECRQAGQVQGRGCLRREKWAEVAAPQAEVGAPHPSPVRT